MTPSQYVESAMCTNNDMGVRNNIIHAAMLLVSESGEVMSEVKRMFAYGKDLDMANIKEELGDILWGVALMCSTLGFRFEDVMSANIAKLSARYPDKCFDPERANNRNPETERQALLEALLSE